MSCPEDIKYAANCADCGLMPIRRYGVRMALERLPERLFNLEGPDFPAGYGAEFDVDQFDESIFGIVVGEEPTPQYELARIVAAERDLLAHGMRLAEAQQRGLGILGIDDGGSVHGQCYHAEGRDLDRVGEQFFVGRPANFSDCCYWRLVQLMVFSPGAAALPKILALAALYTGDCPRVLEEPNKLILEWQSLEWESFFDFQTFHDFGFIGGNGEVMAIDDQVNAADGDTLTIVVLSGPVVSTTFVFEFDSNSSVGMGNIAVEIGADAGETIANLLTAMNTTLAGMAYVSAMIPPGRLFIESAMPVQAVSATALLDEYERSLLYNSEVNAVDGETVEISVFGPTISITLEFDDNGSTLVPPAQVVPIGATPVDTANNLVATLNVVFADPNFASSDHAGARIIVGHYPQPYIIRSNTQFLMSDSLGTHFCEGFLHSYMLMYGTTNASPGDTVTINGYVFEFGFLPSSGTIHVAIGVDSDGSAAALGLAIAAIIPNYGATLLPLENILVIEPDTPYAGPLTITTSSAMFTGVTPGDFGWFFGESESIAPVMTLLDAINMVKAAGVHVELRNQPDATGCSASKTAALEKCGRLLYYF